MEHTQTSMLQGESVCIFMSRDDAVSSFHIKCTGCSDAGTHTLRLCTQTLTGLCEGTWRQAAQVLPERQSQDWECVRTRVK